MKRIIYLSLILLVAGCTSNPKLDSVSIGAIILKADLGYVGEIDEVVPVVLFNFKWE